MNYGGYENEATGSPLQNLSSRSAAQQVAYDGGGVGNTTDCCASDNLRTGKLGGFDSIHGAMVPGVFLRIAGARRVIGIPTEIFHISGGRNRDTTGRLPATQTL